MRLLLVVACALSALAGSPDAPALAAEPVPAERTLVVIGQSGIGPADELEAATGVKPAGAMWYLGLYEDAAAVDALLDDAGAAVASHPGLVVNLGVSFGAVSTPSPSYGAAIVAGAYDDNIRRLAAWLRGLPATAYLRLGYEFDLLGGQYGPPEVYKAAYRHVVDVLRAEGVSNAVYVWHSAGAFWRAADPSFFAVQSGTLAKGLHDADPPETLPIEAFYPGDSYVDAFGISYWGDSCCFGRSAEQARAVYEARTRRILDRASAMGLPLHISESTPVYVGADSGTESVAWVDALFGLVEEYDVRSLSLISIDWQQGGFFAAPFWNGYWPDARVHAYDDTRARFLERVAAERYVTR